MDFQFRMTRALVQDILEKPFDREWSTQGFGMLRTYLDREKVYRLNLWNRQFQVKGVSTIHDHPWHFDSVVIAGKFYNQRFTVLRPDLAAGKRAWQMRIQTGEGGGPTGEPFEVKLMEGPVETYAPGDTYNQIASEVHESKYEDGTVTINERRRLTDGEHANVFWYGSADGWVDAEPRKATRFEVNVATTIALNRWFS